MVKRTLKFLSCLLLAFLLILTTLGYIQYKYAINEISIDDKIAVIQADEHYVELEDVSQYLKDATVAIEDRRFYEHHGVDFIAWLRIIKDLIFTQQINSGGSTITQQLAKNLYFGYEPSLIRKFSELFAAHDLENKYDKDTILELYINIINYGDNNFGIYDAAMNSYHIAPADLDLNQASILAGIPQSPAYLQLSNQSINTIYKQKAVLAAMVKEEMITQAEMDEILKDKLIP